MSKGPENTYKTAINLLIRKSPPEIHAEGMANPYRRGTPDMYYEGQADALWIEYKYLKTIPKILRLVARGTISPHQDRWLSRAHLNNVSVGVIIGTPEGGLFLFGDSYKQNISAATFHKHLMDKKVMAQTIIDVVHGY